VRAAPFLDYRGNKSGNGRRSSRLSARAANCDLKKERGKCASVCRRAPPFARERFSVAHLQADRTEVRDLNPPLYIKRALLAFTPPCSSPRPCANLK
jgi:hypothetical protein